MTVRPSVSYPGLVHQANKSVDESTPAAAEASGSRQLDGETVAHPRDCRGPRARARLQCALNVAVRDLKTGTIAAQAAAEATAANTARAPVEFNQSQRLMHVSMRGTPCNRTWKR